MTMITSHKTKNFKDLGHEEFPAVRKNPSDILQHV